MMSRPAGIRDLDPAPHQLITSLQGCLADHASLLAGATWHLSPVENQSPPVNSRARGAVGDVEAGCSNGSTPSFRRTPR